MDIDQSLENILPVVIEKLSMLTNLSIATIISLFSIGIIIYCIFIFMFKRELKIKNSHIDMLKDQLDIANNGQPDKIFEILQSKLNFAMSELDSKDSAVNSLKDKIIELKGIEKRTKLSNQLVNSEIEAKDSELKAMELAYKNALSRYQGSFEASKLASNQISEAHKKLIRQTKYENPLSEIRSYIQFTLEKSKSTPNIEASSMHLGCDSSLTKQLLAASGYSYHEITEQAKRDISIYYLESRDMPIENIAEHIGFDNAEEFTSAFKSWTGIYPLRYQLMCDETE